MPNGKTHDKITFITTPIIGVLSYYLLNNNLISTLILITTYIFASIMFNGDLDTNSKPYNRWWIFKIIWIPYQLMFSHRSIWSHGIILGTIVRLIYISPIIYCVFQIFNLSLVDINWNLMIIILIGLESGNTIHTLSDKIF